MKYRPQLVVTSTSKHLVLLYIPFKGKERAGKEKCFAGKSSGSDFALCWSDAALLFAKPF